MLCYGDRTWCNSKNCKNKCGRRLTNEVILAAERLELLVACREFCDERGELITPTKRIEGA